MKTGSAKQVRCAIYAAPMRQLRCLQHFKHRIFGGAGCALAWLLVLAGCARRADPPTVTKLAPAPSSKAVELERLAVGNLYDAYLGGSASADALYRGKRYTILGNVVSTASVDAGVSQVVLGSKLEPVIATGVDSAAAGSFINGSAIELECTVTGAVAAMPMLDCGPNGQPRAVSVAR